MARLAFLKKPSMENLEKLKIKCAFAQCMTGELQRMLWEDTCHEVQN